MNFSVSAEKVKELYEMSVTAGRSVSLDGVEVLKTRFGQTTSYMQDGIIISKKTVNNLEGKISINPVNSPEIIDLDAKFRSSPFHKEELTNDAPLNVLFNGFQIDLFADRKVNFRTDLKTNEHHDVSFWETFIQIVRFLTNPDGVEISISNENYPEAYNLKIKTLDSFKGIEDEVRPISILCTLLRKSGYRKELRFSADEVLALHHQLIELAEMISNESSGFKLEIDSSSLELEGELKFIQRVAIPIHSNLLLMIFTGNVNASPEPHEIELYKHKLHRIWIENTDSIENSKFMSVYSDDLRSSIGAELSLFELTSFLCDYHTKDS